MKTVMVLILLAVLAALAGAGVLMLRKSRDSDPQGKQMARALALQGREVLVLEAAGFH